MGWEWLGPDAIYRQIATVLRTRITDGTYQPGHRIPTAAALAEEFGVAANTVRQATALLVREGYLVGAQGRGVFVTSPDDWPGERPAADG